MKAIPAPLNISLLSGLLLTSAALADTTPNYDSIADKIVNQSLKVMPGETIIISGTPAEIELLHALYVATYKAGGKPTIELTLPKANKQAIVQTPIKYIEMPSDYELTKIKHVDGYINVGSVQDPTLFADIPEDKAAALRKANTAVRQALKNANFRSVSLGQTGGIPSKSYAEFVNANYEQMLSNFWQAVDTDYSKLHNSGEKLKKMMQPNTTARLTSPSGTDLTFKLAATANPVISSGKTSSTSANSGPSQTWLPAGEVYACTDPASANGSLVVPRIQFRGNVIKNVKMTVKSGKMVSFSAEQNEKVLKDYFAAAKGDYDVLALVDLGINQHSKPLPGSDYYSWEMAGIVTLAFGDNSWAGCNVESDAGLSLNLANTTLTLNNTPIVKDGKLAE